ncbi:MAG: ATP-dependent sacrificial sulfur transferase LarE [Myxococcales bacterium]|nr:ATP-dependent sacrificial sulfur transferase LarE [Myxococcales bacterium]
MSTALALEGKLAALRAYIRGFSSAVTAYSGGVDSALVMAIAHEELGDAALACVGVSASLAAREERAALALAERLGARVRRVYPEELRDPRYAANPENRCFYCKTALYARVAALASDEGIEAVFDGTNLDDLASDDRPGIAAARAAGVRFPLVEAGLSKADVRAAARELGLPVWDKPAMACTASRVPHGDPITAARLAQIEAAEDVLVELGFPEMRVRCHRDVARIEVPPERLGDLLGLREAIVPRLRALGFAFVTMDLAGLRGQAKLIPTAQLKLRPPANARPEEPREAPSPLKIVRSER